MELKNTSISLIRKIVLATAKDESHRSVALISNWGFEQTIFLYRYSKNSIWAKFCAQSATYGFSLTNLASKVSLSSLSGGYNKSETNTILPRLERASVDLNANLLQCEPLPVLWNKHTCVFLAIEKTYRYVSRKEEAGTSCLTKGCVYCNPIWVTKGCTRVLLA